MQRMCVDHVTEYRFSTPVTLLPHRLMLRPRTSHSVRIESSTLEITPDATVHWQRDAFDNSVALAAFTGESDYLRIASSVVLEHYEQEPLDFVVEDYAVVYPFDYDADELLALSPFRAPTWPGDRDAVDAWLQGLGLPGSAPETYALLDQLNRVIHESMRYEPREEPGVQSPAQSLARGAGSCRDFAALFMDACRHLGLASRFVSGYRHAPLLPPGAAATHAWTELYLPGPGWKGFDPTEGALTGADHVAVAVTHHPERVPPVAGEFVAPVGEHPTMQVSVNVRALPP